MFYKIRKDTQRNETWLKIRHTECGEVFDRVSSNCGKVLNCPKCGNILTVSYLHAIITSIAINNFKGTKMEYDIGFRGNRGGKSKYDLFIPELNGLDTVIEFQSRHHDSKIDFDIKKKNYAISKGYNYMSIDHRDFKIDKAIKEVFGQKYDWDIKDIFLYKKFSYDINKVEELFNNYHTISYISKELDISKDILTKHVAQGIIKQPSDYRQIIRNIKGVVKLSMDGYFINEFDSTYQVLIEENISVSVKYNEVIYSKGYAWITKKDYQEGNYILKNFAKNYCREIIEVDNDNNILNNSNKINDLGLCSTYSESALRKKLNNEIYYIEKTTGRKFMFKYNYNQK